MDEGAIHLASVSRSLRRDSARPRSPAGLTRARRTRALIGSLLLHAGMLAMFFGGASGAIVSGGGGAQSADENAVAVSLAQLSGRRAAAADPQAQTLAAIYQKVLSAQGEVDTNDHKRTPHDSVQRLFDAVDRAEGRGAGRDQGNDAGAEGADSQAKAQTRGGRQAMTPGGGPGATASAASLWGAIEPCWRSVPQSSRVPVTLIVTLDEAGRVASPPLIVRPLAGQIDETRLISEARALAAISACTPYHSADFLGGQRRFTIAFGVSR